MKTRDELVERIKDNNNKLVVGEEKCYFSLDEDGDIFFYNELGVTIGFLLKNRTLKEFYFTRSENIENIQSVINYIKLLISSLDLDIVIDTNQIKTVVSTQEVIKEVPSNEQFRLQGQIDVYERLLAREFNIKA